MTASRWWRASRPAVALWASLACTGAIAAGATWPARSADAAERPVTAPAASARPALGKLPDAGAAAAASGKQTGPCALRLREHRSGRRLLTASLDAAPARLVLGFTHSVLGTPVSDVYQWRGGQWWLIEEHFEGQGYGLPHAAAAGERLVSVGRGSVLHLNRVVSPLVVRPLPLQRMRVLLADGRSWLLGDLSTQAIEIDTQGC